MRSIKLSKALRSFLCRSVALRSIARCSSLPIFQDVTMCLTPQVLSYTDVTSLHNSYCLTPQVVPCTASIVLHHSCCLAPQVLPCIVVTVFHQNHMFCVTLQITLYTRYYLTSHIPSSTAGVLLLCLKEMFFFNHNL